MTSLFWSPKAQEACGAHEIDNALDIIKSLEDQLEEIRRTADAEKLLPLPGETVRHPHFPSIPSISPS